MTDTTGILSNSPPPWPPELLEAVANKHASISYSHSREPDKQRGESKLFESAINQKPKNKKGESSTKINDSTTKIVSNDSDATTSVFSPNYFTVSIKTIDGASSIDANGISGNNFFIRRDLAQKLGFEVSPNKTTLKTAIGDEFNLYGTVTVKVMFGDDPLRSIDCLVVDSVLPGIDIMLSGNDIST